MNMTKENMDVANAYRSMFSEAAMKNPWDNEYNAILKKMKKLDWNSKPRKAKQSAMNTLDGEIGKYSVEFTWHQPDTKWGNGWNMMGAFINPKGSHSLKEYKADQTDEILRSEPKSTDEMYKGNIKSMNYLLDNFDTIAAEVAAGVPSKK